MRWTDGQLPCFLGTYADLGNRQEAENKDFGQGDVWGSRNKNLSSLGLKQCKDLEITSMMRTEGWRSELKI